MKCDLSSARRSDAYAPIRQYSDSIWLGLAALFVIFLLYIPVMYYSLTTPFALVDDYGMCYFVEFLDNSKRFLNWFDTQVVHFSYGRYRPFFDLYNMITWKIFGPSAWLHHLARWALHFASIFFFVVTFAYIQQTSIKQRVAAATSDESIPITPLLMLMFTWLFFPNVPASRLGPQEVNTVFFLGLCNWMMAMFIVGNDNNRRRLSQIIHYALLYLSYVGISMSKEINIAVMLWIVLFYYFLCVRNFNVKRIILGLPLIAIFLFTLSKIIIASTNNYYGTRPITLDLIVTNSLWIYKDLFQLNTSAIIATVFMVLTALLLIKMFVKIIKGNVNDKLLYTLFLLGQFIALFMILTTSWAKVLRYWYPLIPLLSMLLAFSIDDVLETAKRYHINHIIAAAVVCFVIYFTGCNYYTFLLQTAAQHSIRNAEYNLIYEIKELEQDGHYVYIMNKKNDPDAELVLHLIAYFRRFEPRFNGTQYRVHTTPPTKPGQTYFLVTRQTEPADMEIHRLIQAEQNYRMLTTAFKISTMFRGSPPLYIKDAGVDVLSKYKWTIYKARA